MSGAQKPNDPYESHASQGGPFGLVDALSDPVAVPTSRLSWPGMGLAGSGR